MLKILHLSDPHFGQLLPAQLERLAPNHPKCAHKHRDGSDRSDPSQLASILLNDAELQSAPDVVVLTGDVGWAGTKEDYEPAAVFINSLRDRWKAVDFVVLPGNHDVDQQRPDARQAAFFEFVQNLHGKDFESRYPFVSEQLERDLFVTCLEIPPTSVRADGALIVGVNSAAALEGSSTPVHIAPRALEKISMWLRGKSVEHLRLFALHHHLLPFAEHADEQQVVDQADKSIVGNSAKLQAWLAQNNFHLVLHGHKHKWHGRVDTLWRKGEPSGGRTVLVVSAGSAGVYDEQRLPEPLGYNIIEATRVSTMRWSVDSRARAISNENAFVESSDLFAYTADVGPPHPGHPSIFSAERMDDCHAAISKATRRSGLLQNFISIVDRCEYRHPPTCLNGSAVANETDIRKSFRALHPEHAATENWTDLTGMEGVLKGLPERFQFQHGPRLFEIPHPYPVLLADGKGNLDSVRPILRALKELGGNSHAHAYVSLYRPDIDVLSQREEPFPSLMSLQFLKDGDDGLNLVATFRKLELSYWWVVNMFETIQLLKWAAGDGLQLVGGQRRAPRRITLFAALAQWKPKPDPPMVTELDDAELSKLSKVSLDAIEGKSEELLRLLREKRSGTNPQNLDAGGLDRLAQILAGALPRAKATRRKKLGTAVQKMQSAVEHIRTAMKNPKDTSRKWERDLDAAIQAAEQALVSKSGPGER